MIMEIALLIMEKSWKNHGILFFNFCGNPELMLIFLYNFHGKHRMLKLVITKLSSKINVKNIILELRTVKN